MFTQLVAELTLEQERQTQISIGPSILDEWHEQEGHYSKQEHPSPQEAWSLPCRCAGPEPPELLRFVCCCFPQESWNLDFLMKSLDFLKLLTSSIFVHTVLINKNHLSVSGAWLQAPGLWALVWTRLQVYSVCSSHLMVINLTWAVSSETTEGKCRAVLYPQNHLGKYPQHEIKWLSFCM